MNDKGQMGSVGTVLMVAVALIICMTILSQAVFPNIGTMTNTISNVNKTFTFPAAGGNVTLDGQANTNLVITNRSNGVSVPASNYTVTNYVILADGTIGSRLQANAGMFANQPVNISSTVEPLGYVRESGTRPVINLIAIFAALAAIVIALVPAVNDNIRSLLDI